MKKLIIISGDLAAGKSRFAIKLANTYQIPVFSKDIIKERLCDTIPFTNRQENKNLSIAAVQIMIQIFQDLAQTGNDLILESNFHLSELEEIDKMSEKLGYQILMMELIGTPEILYQRFQYRLHQENRHIAHRSLDFNDLETFKAYLIKNRSIRPRIIINADDYSYQDDPNILKQIKHFLKD